MTKNFKDDDAGYEDWIRRNPTGFVVNTTRNPSAGYLKLHRASCRTISGTPPRGGPWNGLYVKVCAATVLELSVWARSSTGGSLLDPCGLCHPTT